MSVPVNITNINPLSSKNEITITFSPQISEDATICYVSPNDTFVFSEATKLSNFQLNIVLNSATVNFSQSGSGPALVYYSYYYIFVTDIANTVLAEAQNTNTKIFLAGTVYGSEPNFVTANSSVKLLLRDAFPNTIVPERAYYSLDYPFNISNSSIMDAFSYNPGDEYCTCVVPFNIVENISYYVYITDADEFLLAYNQFRDESLDVISGITSASPVKASFGTTLTITLSTQTTADGVRISQTSDFINEYVMTDLTPVSLLSYTFKLTLDVSDTPPSGEYYVTLYDNVAISARTLFELILAPELSLIPPIVPSNVNQSGTVSLNGFGLNLITEVQLTQVSLRLGETFSFSPSSFIVNPESTQLTFNISSASPVPPPGTYTVLGIYNGGTLSFGNLTITGDTPPFIICFKEDTKIACLQDNTETDIFIQNLKSGDLVKTYKHGYLPVNVVGRNICYNPKNAQRLKSRLFKLKREKYPALKEDLIVTGCHSILESTISQTKGEELMDINKRIYTTDELIRLPAYLDDRSDPYLDEYGDINVYHVALGNDESRNYGIYANGLLVESCFIPRIKNEMTIIS